MNGRKAVAVGILVLFIGASILPIISGAPQNLVLLKNSGRQGKAYPKVTHEKIQKDSKNNLEKNQKADTKVQTHPEKSTLNPKDTKQVTSKIKHETTVPSFVRDTTIIPSYTRGEGDPQPLANNVHNVNSGQDFATIQEAIDDEGTLNGHTLVVSQGTYPENVLVSKSLTIRGNNATSIPVIDGMGTVCFNITANSVTVKWLNFTNATNAINCSASGFSVLNNTFYYDTNGVVWRIYKTNLAASQNILASMVKYNTFYSNNTSPGYKAMIYVDLELYYQNNSGYTVSIGDITINQNTFYLNSSTQTTAFYFDSIYVYYLYGGTVSVGKINISGNTIYGGDEGLDFYGEFYQIKNVLLTAGDFIVTHNLMVNQTSYGIYIDYYDGESWSGTTHAVFGELQITDNSIQTNRGGLDGIEVSDYGYWYNYTDTASLVVGDMTIQDNTLDVTGYGIYFEMQESGTTSDQPLADHSSVTLGDFVIVDNTVTSSDDDGIYIYIDDVGHWMYDYAAFTMGDLICNDNTINSQGQQITDNITDTVHLARNYYEGLYNAVTESHYIFGYSPDNTEWSWVYDVPQSDPTILSYTDWRDAVNTSPPNMVGKVIYMHIISEDRYFQMNFTYWKQSGGGGFSYTRYEVVNGTVGVGVDFTRPNLPGGGDGIYVSDIDYIGEEMYDYTTCTIGDLQFNGNIIHVSTNYGIDLSWIGDIGEDMYNHSQCTMGDLQVNENTIISDSSDGIYIDYGYFGYDLGENPSDHCVFTMGDITCNNNDITSWDDGIYVSEIEDVGEDLYGSSTFTMGDIQFNNNNINSSDSDGIYLDDIEYFGYDMYDSSRFTMGNIESINNTIYAGNGDGIYVYIYEIGYDLYDNAICSVGDFLFNYNTINATDDDGLYFDYIEEIGYDMYDNAQFSMGDIQANYNTIIAGDGYGIYIEWYDFGYYLGGASDESVSFVMGDLTCCYNNITSTNGEGIYTEDVDDIGVEMYGTSTCTIGNIQFNHNIINATNDDGLYLYDPEYFGYDMYDESEFTMGNLEANDNTIYAGNGYGIYLYYDEFGYYMGEDSTDACIFTMGDITVNNNTIVNSGDDGIYTEEFDYFGYEMYGSSMFTMGNIQFNHNTVTTSGLGNYGFYLDYFGDFGEELNDNSQVVMGNIEFNDNVVNSTDGEGMYFDIYDIGYDMYDNSTFAMGSIQVNRNVITSDSYGIDMYWIGDIGEYLEDYAQASMRNIETNDNIVTNTNDYGMYLDVGDIGYDLTGHSSFFVNNIIFINNTVTSGQDGINVDTTDWINEEIYDDAQFYGRGPYLAFNTINATNIGILVSDSSEVIVACNTVLTADIGIEVNDICDNITVAYHTLNGTGNDGVLIDQSDYNTILGNSINASINKNGITLTDSNNNLISRNTISNNTDTGINVTVSTNNMIYHNNILNNTLQAFDDSNASNTWDNGYPSGGNYWSDYTGIDDDGDGIGETPYNITGYIPNDQDRYPLTDRVVINHPSLYTPSGPSPANGATGVSVYNDIGWSGGDPDNDYDNYDIYFGTTNPPTYNDTVYFIQGSPIGYELTTLALDTTYYWKIVAWDAFGDSVSGPVWSFTTGTPSQYPEIPPVYHYAPSADPDGPYNGDVNTPVQFDGTGSHTNGDGGTIVAYDWEFFDSDTFHNLGPTPTHTYSTAGTYTVTLRVTDSGDGIGIGSTTVTIRGVNTPPNTPIVAGPTTGAVSTAYTYSFTATDPDNNNIQYVIDWGDGTAKITSPFSASGNSYAASHTWTTSGIYSIKVYAEDIYSGISGTATYYVTIGTPTTQPINGYLVDTNGDGIPDSWHNNVTGQTTQAQKQADGTYLVDTDGDGVYDHVYNPATGAYSAYTPAPAEGTNWLLWGGVIVIVLIIIGGLALIMRRRKK